MKTPRREFKLKRGAISFTLGVGVFFLSGAIETWLHTFNIRGFWEWTDNCFGAIATGMIVYFYERRQHRRDLARLRIIAEMNHHIRNALQPILYLAESPMPRELQSRLIRECVDRIQWALTQVLPGEAEAPRHTEWHPKQHPGDAA